MIVSTQSFNVFTGNCETSPKVDAMKERILRSAEEVVSDYLGYSPEISQRTETLSGIGSDRIYPYGYNITEVASLEIGGSVVSASDYEIHSNYIRLKTGVFPAGINNVVLTYTAGWATDSMPDIIPMTIMQIGSLLLQEAGGNIGITGKAFGENSRTYINYTNFDKWLAKLAKYKVFRME